MSSSSIRGFLFVLIGFFLLLASTNAKPSHPYGLHAVPDHFEAWPPLLPQAHVHAIPPPPPPPAAVFAAPAPLPLAAPAPVFAPAPLPPPLPATYFAAPLPIPLPAPIPAPVFAPAPLPPPVHLTRILPPVVEALPFAVPVAPTYRAIPGPKTTTHHVSIGYAFPAPAAKLVAQPVLHSHLSAAPVSLGHSLHHKFHSLF